jgi:S-adenosylmethionine:tRNA ribosyltransferase-isomerase
MKTSDFDYGLPEELIAQHPLADRSASRMMVANRATGEIRHERFRDIGRFLQPGDLLVLNDTKVLPARLWSQPPRVELLLIEALGGNRWSSMVKPGKRAKIGDQLTFEDGLTAVVVGETEFGGRVLQFSGDVRPYLARHGVMPLPPYIKRDSSDPVDQVRYQTVFARESGAVAAPTAGLHFTRELLDQLQAQGIAQTYVTLHVGIGTFRPVKVEEVEEHKMHAERFVIPPATANALREAKRVVAVGTTVVRTLESVGEARACEGSTEIFIRPPYQFKMVDVLLTNFHLPRSTLLMLVSAFATRELIRQAYREAVREKYRFFSYGDCMLIV